MRTAYMCISSKHINMCVWWLGLRKTAGFGIPGAMTQDRSWIFHSVYSIRGWEATFMASRQNYSSYYRSCEPHSRRYGVTITGLLVTVFQAGHPRYGDARATHSSWSQLSSLLECLHVHAPFSWQTLFTASSWNHHVSVQIMSFWLGSLLYYSLRVQTSFCLDMSMFLHASC